MTDKVKQLGWLVSLVTIVSSLLFVGSQFGQLQGSIDESILRNDQLAKRLDAVETFTHDAAVSAAQIATDLTWMRKSMTEVKQQRKEIRVAISKLQNQTNGSVSKQFIILQRGMED